MLKLIIFKKQTLNYIMRYTPRLSMIQIEETFCGSSSSLSLHTRFNYSNHTPTSIMPSPLRLFSHHQHHHHHHDPFNHLVIKIMQTSNHVVSYPPLPCWRSQANFICFLTILLAQPKPTWSSIVEFVCFCV
jgi:hypothetical protein